MANLESLLETCKQSGLRRTKALKAVLDAMIKKNSPFSLLDLEQEKMLQGVCDRTTIFRTIQRLESIGLLRRLNFSEEKSTKFSIHDREKHQEYLICQSCSNIQAVEVELPVNSIGKKVAETSGFTKMSYDLTFYGICQDCQKNAS